MSGAMGDGASSAIQPGYYPLGAPYGPTEKYMLLVGAAVFFMVSLALASLLRRCAVNAHRQHASMLHALRADNKCTRVLLSTDHRAQPSPTHQ